ncbi:VOC family protein [Zhongshania sp.]
MYLPDGYGTIFPYMLVNGANSLCVFLADVFGAEEMGRTVFPDGRIANIRIRIGTSNFMISETDGSAMKSMPGAYYIYVEDVDDTYKRALSAGAKSIFEPADMPYLDRQAGVVDPTGNNWWISKRLVEEPYDS